MKTSQLTGHKSYTSLNSIGAKLKKRKPLLSLAFALKMVLIDKKPHAKIKM